MDIADFEEDEPPRRKKSTSKVDSIAAMLKKHAEVSDPLRTARLALEQFETATAFQRLLYEQQELKKSLVQRFEEISKPSAFFEQQSSVGLSVAERYEVMATSLGGNTAWETYKRLAGQSRVLEEVSRIPQDLRRWMTDLAKGQSLQQAALISDQWGISASESFLKHFRNPLSDLATSELFESIATRAKFFEQEPADSSFPIQQLTEARVTEVSRDAQVIVQQAANAPTLQDALEQIKASIEASRDTLTQKLLWFVLVPLFLMMLASIVNPLADHYIKGKLSESAQGAEKQVKERAADAVGDLRVLVNYRYVSASVLTVRSNAKARAPSVGNLRFGQAVRIVEIRGAFTQVLWISPDGTSELKGWVFSRYLRQFD